VLTFSTLRLADDLQDKGEITVQTDLPIPEHHCSAPVLAMDSTGAWAQDTPCSDPDLHISSVTMSSFCI
jgi:hypothetical protein